MTSDARLPDPRRYGAGAAHPLNSIADASELRSAITQLLKRGDDAQIFSALAAADSQPGYARLWRAVTDAANHSGDIPGAIVARLFAVPLVIVAGSRRPAQLPGVVPDIGAITELFKQHGALGPTQNFGLGNALCALETLETMTPGEVFRWTRDVGSDRRELPPSPISLATPGETVQLRFIVGAAIMPAVEPSFVETASNVGKWGMPLTRELGKQLAQPNVDVLPLARPPRDLLTAAHAGRFAQLETAFNLFAGNAVRKLRSATGDPVAVISAHNDGDVRVSLNSPFDDSLSEGFRWPLHPLDDLDSVVASLAGMLADCRITHVDYSKTVLPALNQQGQIWFARKPDALPPALASH